MPLLHNADQVNAPFKLSLFQEQSKYLRRKQAIKRSARLSGPQALVGAPAKGAKSRGLTLSGLRAMLFSLGAGPKSVFLLELGVVAQLIKGYGARVQGALNVLFDSRGLARNLLQRRSVKYCAALSWSALNCVSWLGNERTKGKPGKPPKQSARLRSMGLS